MDHKHEYIPHPNPDWATHHCCRICGFALPNRYVPENQIVAVTDRILTGVDPKGDARLVAAIEGDAS